MFSCEICEIFKTTFFIQPLRTTVCDSERLLFMTSFLQKENFCSLHFNICQTQISLDKILKSINSKTNNKSPGNGGLTVELYKHFSKELAHVLLEVDDSLGKLGTIGVTSRTGIISVKYKIRDILQFLKMLSFGKKFKDKLRTKPGFLSRRR